MGIELVLRPESVNREMKGQFLSVDFLIGILAVVAIFGIGVSYFDSIANQEVSINSAIAASDLILASQGENLQNVCYRQSRINGNVLVDTCQDLQINFDNCKGSFTAKRFTIFNLTEESCFDGCILEVKTCEG